MEHVGIALYRPFTSNYPKNDFMQKDVRKGFKKDWSDGSSINKLLISVS